MCSFSDIFYLLLVYNSMRSEIIQFHNCLILRDGKIIKEDLWTCDGKIVDPEPIFFDKKDYADIKIDCKGLLIAPGFIDLQVNGNIILRLCFLRW